MKKYSLMIIFSLAILLALSLIVNLSCTKDDTISTILDTPARPIEKIGKDGAEMVLIPAGEFQMGTDELEIDGIHIREPETPRHRVSLDPFYIDKDEVNNAQYKRFVQATGHREPQGWAEVDGEILDEFKPWDDPKFNDDNNPVVCVSWHDAVAYAEWAGKRLPTEAEWEKAARSVLVGEKYPWGNGISHDDANYEGTEGKDVWEYTSPSGSFPPNQDEIYDMAGNVWEWCADWYGKDYYKVSLEPNPEGPESGEYRVLRGGSFGSDTNETRVAYRNSNFPTDRRFSVGFRCVQDVIK